MKVAAHAHGTEGMLRAVRAGVHSIEHGTYMTDEVMAAMKEKGTYYVPTISAGPLRRREGQDRRLLPGGGAAEGGRDRSADPGHVRARRSRPA